MVSRRNTTTTTITTEVPERHVRNLRYDNYTVSLRVAIPAASGMLV